MKTESKSPHQPFTIKAGIVMLTIGIAALIGIGIYEIGHSSPPAKVIAKAGSTSILQTGDPVNISSIVAIGFLLIMLSIAFIFPDMLKGGRNGSTSSMRVAVYMIICVFVFLAVKIGWNCDAFQNFHLDNTWAYVIAAALGSKALQSFSENRDNAIAQSAAVKPNTGPDISNAANPGLIKDFSTISDQLPLTAPSAILKKL